MIFLTPLNSILFTKTSQTEVWNLRVASAQVHNTAKLGWLNLFTESVTEMEGKFADLDSKNNLITDDCHASSWTSPFAS